MLEKLDLENLATFRLSRLADTLERAASLVYGRDHEINLTAWRALALLYKYEPTTVQEISRRSRIDKGWISRSVARLEERGLLTRTVNRNDNRSVLLSLTDAGRRMVAENAPRSMHRHDTLLSVLGDAERKMFLNALDLIQQQADKMLADAENGGSGQ